MTKQTDYIVNEIYDSPDKTIYYYVHSPEFETKEDAERLLHQVQHNIVPINKQIQAIQDVKKIEKLNLLFYLGGKQNGLRIEQNQQIIDGIKNWYVAVEGILKDIMGPGKVVSLPNFKDYTGVDIKELS